MTNNTLKISYVLCVLLPVILFGAKRQGPPPVSVETAAIHMTTYQEKLTFLGSLSAKQGVTLKTETSGLITKLPVKSGQYVKKGQMILQTNPSVLEGQLAGAIAALKLAQQNAMRTDKLYKSHVVSPQAQDSTQNALSTARANLKTIEAQLEQTIIRAPFSGQLGLLQAQLGDYVTMGKDIVNLQQNKNLWVDFSVPQNQISQIKNHSKILVYQQGSTQKLSAKWVASESLVDPSTRKLHVRAHFDNAKKIFLPGEFVLVEVNIGLPKKVITVPQYSIEYSPEGTYIYKLVKGKAVKTKVLLGLRKEDWVVVKEGLKKHDTIITAGRHKIYPNATLIINPSPHQGDSA